MTTGSSWLWNVNKTESEAKRILADPEDKRFVHYAALLLSRRRGLPKEIFEGYLSREHFCGHWHAIKRKMRKDNWNDQRIPFWDEIYKRLVADFKKKGVVFPREKKITFKDPAWEKAAEGIRSRRRARKMTQGDLAKKMGVTQQFVAKIESGTQNLSMTTLGKIEKALGGSRHEYKTEEVPFQTGRVSASVTTWLTPDPGANTESK